MQTKTRIKHDRKQQVAESLRALNLHLVEKFGLRSEVKRLCAGCVSLSDSNASDLVTTDEASHLLGIGSKTLENWRTAGKGPIYNKIGSRVLYAVGDLRDFLKERRRTSTSGEGVRS